MTPQPRPFLLCTMITIFSIFPTEVGAISGRIGLQGIRLEPQGEVDNFSDAKWGGAIEGVIALPVIHKLVAVDVGLEAARFATETVDFQPGPFQFARTLTTSQDFTRFYLGFQVGPHGHGFLQPYVALHGAVVNHSISSTLSEEFNDPSQNRSQTFSESDTGVGYDIGGGVHLNINNRFGTYAGVKYVHSFGVNQPLGDEQKEIDPEYFQVFAGVSINLGFLSKLED